MRFFKTRVHLEQAGQRAVVPLWEYDTEAPTSQSQLAYTSLPLLQPVFSRLLVAKPFTDVLEDGFAIGGAGFLVSQKLRTLLETFNLGAHQFYTLETFCYANGIPLTTPYYWLQLVALDCYALVDYTTSAFVLVDDVEEQLLAEVAFQGPAELQAAVAQNRQEDRSLRYTKLAFLESATTKPQDIMYLNDLSDTELTYPLFSERLKQELEAQAIVGLEFKQAPVTWTRA